MSAIIEFSIVPSKQGLYKDFLMRIPALNKEFAFDTYHFWDGGYYTDDYDILIPKIESHLIKCRNSIIKLLKNQSTYILIEISDEYYGVFKVTLFNNTYEFIFGAVDKAGCNILEDDETDSLNIGNNYFDKDFTIDLQKEDVMDSFKLLPPQK